VNLIHRELALAYELQRKLENWLESFEPDLLPSDSNERDELHEETVRRLRALGYVDF
jgi:hypothetical protein